MCVCVGVGELGGHSAVIQKGHFVLAGPGRFLTLKKLLSIEMFLLVYLKDDVLVR